MTYLRLISSFLLLLTFIHCSDRNEEVRIINGTFIYINETEDSVYVAGNCGLHKRIIMVHSSLLVIRLFYILKTLS